MSMLAVKIIKNEFSTVSTKFSTFINGHFHIPNNFPLTITKNCENGRLYHK